LLFKKLRFQTNNLDFGSLKTLPNDPTLKSEIYSNLN